MLDLDNTLWGGVVGDDGLEVSGSGATPRARPSRRFRSTCSRLKAAASCSLSARRTSRRSHARPSSASGDAASARRLRCFEASWDPKPEDLRRIAATLDLGLDALVFVDDNPAETRGGPAGAARSRRDPLPTTRPGTSGRSPTTRSSRRPVSLPRTRSEPRSTAHEHRPRSWYARPPTCLRSGATSEMEAELAPVDDAASAAGRPADRQDEPVQRHHPPSRPRASDRHGDELRMDVFSTRSCATASATTGLSASRSPRWRVTPS